LGDPRAYRRAERLEEHVRCRLLLKILQLLLYVPASALRELQACEQLIENFIDVFRLWNDVPPDARRKKIQYFCVSITELLQDAFHLQADRIRFALADVQRVGQEGMHPR